MLLVILFRIPTWDKSHPLLRSTAPGRGPKPVSEVQGIGKIPGEGVEGKLLIAQEYAGAYERDSSIITQAT